MPEYGPTLPVSEAIHSMKYRSRNETFEEAMTRVADALKDDSWHFQTFRDILLDMRFLPAGRVQSAMGAPRIVTPYNCFVSATILDSMEGIMKAAADSATTMRLGGGIGYDFSTLRPRGDLIKSLDSKSSGPVSFMGIFDAVCKTIASAGHRRGAQMGVLRVDHPDIEEFIEAKANTTALTQFNISVGVTDAFMQAVKDDTTFDLVFDGRVYKVIRARYLWDKIMRMTWDWAEPGILFIDRINEKNNLWYCETIAATNPCGEQPLPPDGACLLGSFNLTKYVKPSTFYHDFDKNGSPYFRSPKKKEKTSYIFDYDQFAKDIPWVVRAMDNVVDRAVYPLPAQEVEAKSKRRMGLGVTGVANAIEAIGYPYGSPKFLAELEKILKTLRDTAYTASVQLAIDKGPFPLYDKKLLDSGFAKTLPENIREIIEQHGLRNSHLLSIAPTGTISFSADNISSGIEPVYSMEGKRIVQTFEGPRTFDVSDFAYREWGVQAKTTDLVTPKEHVDVLTLASRYVDSACSKTCNIGDNVSWEDFKDVYMRAYDGGASGCTTFRAAGKRYGIFIEEDKEDTMPLPVQPDTSPNDESGACYFDPATGLRACE